MSSRGAAKKFLRAVELQAQRQQKKRFVSKETAPIKAPILHDIVYRFSVDELKQIATTAGVRVPSFHELLEKLNHQVSPNLLIVTSSFFLNTLEN